jgi:hypothetical protein
MLYKVFLLVASCCLTNTSTTNAFQQQQPSSRRRVVAYHVPARFAASHLNTALQQGFLNEDLSASRLSRDPTSCALSAVSIGNLDGGDIQMPDGEQDDISAAFGMSSPLAQPLQQPQASDWSSLAKVMTTALMITGNTIGAGSLVLPDIAAKPGLAASTGIFLGKCYALNHGKAMLISPGSSYSSIILFPVILQLPTLSISSLVS